MSSVLDCAVEAACQGEKVLVVTRRMSGRGRILEALAERAGESARVFRMNGCERVEFRGGGTICFQWMPDISAVRGLSFEMVLVDGWEVLSDVTFVEAVTPCFATQHEAKIGVLI